MCKLSLYINNLQYKSSPDEKREKKSRDVKNCSNINQFKLKMAVLSTPVFKALLCFKIEASSTFFKQYYFKGPVWFFLRKCYLSSCIGLLYFEFILLV